MSWYLSILVPAAKVVDVLRTGGLSLIVEERKQGEKTMATTDVPGANPANADVLAMGCWAEHSDGSLIFVESVEAGRVVYSLFDVARDPVIEYRDAMPEDGFKSSFSWEPGDQKKSRTLNLQWTWHDKTVFPWERVMGQFPSGPRLASATAQQTAAERVAESLGLRAERIRERHAERPTLQRAATTIMRGFMEAIEAVAERER